MADQPPELIDQVGATAEGTAWRARQPDGREVLAFQVRLPDETSRQAALDRLRRIARISDRHLAPVRGWWADASGVWWVGDLEQGLALPDLPGGGFLSPQQAAVISFSVLEGLKALQDEGLSHGALNPSSVRVMPDGAVRLTGHQVSTLGFPNQEELTGEIREAGRIVCQAFGITPERTTGAPRAIEHAAPALVVTARAIAAGNMRSDVSAALSALRETAGPLAGTERLGLGASELSSLVGAKLGTSTGEMRFRSLSTPIGASTAGPPPPAPAPPRPAPPPPPQPSAPASFGPPRPITPAEVPATSPAAGGPAPRRSWEERQALPPEEDEGDGPNWLLIGAIALAVLLLAAGAWFGRGLLFGSSSPTGSTSPGPSAQPSSHASGPAPSPSPTFVPGVIPTFAPTSAGAIKSVTIKQASPSCSPGASCTFEVLMTFTPYGSPTNVTWSFKVYDMCTGATTDIPGGSISVQGDWNNTDGNTALTLPPAKGQLAVVALSGGSDVAASSPLQVGSAGGC